MKEKSRRTFYFQTEFQAVLWVSVCVCVQFTTFTTFFPPAKLWASLYLSISLLSLALALALSLSAYFLPALLMQNRTHIEGKSRGEKKREKADYLSFSFNLNMKNKLCTHAAFSSLSFLLFWQFGSRSSQIERQRDIASGFPPLFRAALSIPLPLFILFYFWLDKNNWIYTESRIKEQYEWYVDVVIGRYPVSCVLYPDRI